MAGAEMTGRGAWRTLFILSPVQREPTRPSSKAALAPGGAGDTVSHGDRCAFAQPTVSLGDIGNRGG